MLLGGVVSLEICYNLYRNLLKRFFHFICLNYVHILIFLLQHFNF